MTRVLVVDDNDDIRLLLTQVLSMRAIEAYEAPGGAQAITMVPRLEPDLVLLDVQMPEMDGWETLAVLRNAHPELRIVLCTVKASLEDVQHGWLLGCDGYVTKPFDVSELLDVVEEVCNRSERERDAVREAALEATRRAMAG